MFKTLLTIVFLFIMQNMSFAAPATNCSQSSANIFFKNPTIILKNYSAEYYCSDILYLEKNKIGNIPVAEYKNLYGTFSPLSSYLQSIGITPDIIDKYIDDENDASLTTELAINNFMKTMIAMGRTNSDFIITSAPRFEPTKSFNPSQTIENEDGASCIIEKEATYTSANSLYLNQDFDYYTMMKSLPPAMSPIAVVGSDLVNIFGEVVATINSQTSLGGGLAGITVGARSIKTIKFHPDIFENKVEVNVNWNDKNCKVDTLESLVANNSVCFMCPYIIMLMNEISYLFNFMYDTFKEIIIIFLVLFGCFFFLTTFLKSLKSLPFDVDLSGYYKTISEKLRLIFIVSAVLLLPPRIILSFSFEPILNLTMGVADTVLKSTGTISNCNPDTVVDAINKKRSDAINDNIIPPVVKQNIINADAKLATDTILSKQTLGSIVCFLTDTIEANGKQMMLGRTLMSSIFNLATPEKFLKFIMGFLIFTFFFMINFMISFYILDGMLELLKIAILWPLMVFGYAFSWVKFNVTDILNTAKDFGMTMISLAIFTIFNITMIHSFTFTNGAEPLITILDKAIQTNDKMLILNAIPSDIISISKFLFIVYAMYYVYSKLSEFTSSFGGKIGGLSVGQNMKNTLDSFLKVKVNREDKPQTLKKEEKQKEKPENDS